MNCTNKQETCDVEKRGCEGCFYNEKTADEMFKEVRFKIYNNDCLKILEKLKENSIDSIVTDPPYELNFMSKGWDNAGVSFNKETWEKCLRVLKPRRIFVSFWRK